MTSTRVADDIDADAKPGSEGSRVGEGEGEGEGEPSSRVGSRPRAAADEIREGLRRASRAIASRDAVAATRGHAGPVTAVAFAPACVVFPADDPVLATASEDGTVRLWRAANVASRADATELVDDETSADSATTASEGDRAVPDSVTSVSWGARAVDGALALVVATVSGALVLRRVGKRASGARDGESESSFFRVSPAIRLSPRDGQVSSHALDASGRRVAAGHVDGTVRVWCAVTGAASVSPTRRHAATVSSVAFHPAGWQLCSGGGAGDGVGKVWDLAGMTGRAPGSCAHTLRWDAGAVTRVSYAPCGRLIVTATAAPLAAAGRGAFRLLVWSAVSGRLCKWYDSHDAPVTAFAWNPGTRVPDGNRVGNDDPSGRRAVAVFGRRRRRRRRGALHESGA